MNDLDPTAMFERMYGAAADGQDRLPWDRGGPHPLLEAWARDLDGAGRRALVVGSGLGTDADLLDLPGEWSKAFDLVVESLTVQSMPIEYHAQASTNVARTVADGGTLLVIATAREELDGIPDGPPWPLTRAEIEAFAADRLTPVQIEDIREPAAPARG